jgi:protein-disulfide isomerase-like protein with CxxC motif
MTLKFKTEYLSAIRKRYYQGRKCEKTQILNELCAVTGFNRKYAIRILAIKHHEGKKLSGNKNYSERSVAHLKRLWVRCVQRKWFRP